MGVKRSTRVCSVGSKIVSGVIKIVRHPRAMGVIQKNSKDL